MEMSNSTSWPLGPDRNGGTSKVFSRNVGAERYPLVRFEVERPVHHYPDLATRRSEVNCPLYRMFNSINDVLAHNVSPG